MYSGLKQGPFLKAYSKIFTMSKAALSDPEHFFRKNVRF